MSQAKVDAITDSAGTGPVDFPQGLTAASISGQTPSMIRLDTIAGHGSTNTKIAYFTNVTSTTGTDITYTPSSVNGDSFTINVSGTYAVGWAGIYNAGTFNGISVNSGQLTTSVLTINQANRLAFAASANSDNPQPVYWSGPLTAGDVIRPHDAGQALDTDTDRAFFFIARVG